MEKIDFDKLYDECEKAGRIGIFPMCEEYAFENGEPVEERVLCWCGVCIKYHHDDYYHEELSVDQCESGE